MQPFTPNLRRPGDADEPGTLQFDEDQQAVLNRSLSDMLCALSLLQEGVSSGELDRRHAGNVMRVMEHQFKDLCTGLGVQLDTAEAVAQRHAMLREAHQRVHLLEAELASRNARDVAMGLKGLEERLKHWWRTEGFGHTSECEFHSYGCTAKLSANLFSAFRSSFSTTPVSDKVSEAQWLDGLREQGFVLVRESPHSKDYEVVDCKASREALQTLISKTMPCCEIQGFYSQVSRATGDMVLRDIEVLIRDLDALGAMPAPSPKLAPA